MKKKGENERDLDGGRKNGERGRERERERERERGGQVGWIVTCSVGVTH
jgi:hypothetical protein